MADILAMAYCTPRKALKVVLFLVFSCFLVINVKFLSVPKTGLSTSLPNIPSVTVETIAETKRNVRSNVSPANSSQTAKSQGAAPPILTGKKPEPVEVKVQDNSSAEKDRDKQFNESLSFIIRDINSKQTIHNIKKFPPSAENGTAYSHTFAVQVHNRDHYLDYLVSSLRTVTGINQSLLIVSHDYYSKEVFDIISSIDFMPVIQIFYPKAMQLYKNKYPGPDPADCPRDIKKPEAVKRGCINAEYPDKYGHYREAAYAQTKLHWFWKLRQIFEGLDIMRNYKGYVTLVEEDHYMTPDALHVLNMMINNKEKLCKHCRIFTLGNYDKKPNYAFTDEVVAATDFISSKHNMAMSLNRETYELIKRHKEAFCEYDDYNWDWSMQYLSKEVIPGKLPTLIVKTPRVYHIGDCGVHHKGKKCNPEDKAKPIRARIEGSKDKLFPGNLKIGKANTYTFINVKKMKANGGWGDKRDHQLCSSFMADT